jgi:MFS family permease
MIFAVAMTFVAAQIGGRLLDRIGAKRPVVLGCVLAAVGFFL